MKPPVKSAAPRAPRRRESTPVAAGRPSQHRAGLDLGPLPNLIGYALRRAQVAVFSDFLASFATLDLRPAQFSVLLLIRHNPGCRQSDVAEALGILRPNFVAMMDELDQRGLTERTTSRDDRRSYALSLTAPGEALLQAAMKVVVEHEGRLTAAMAPDDPATLLEILGRIERGLSAP